MRYFFRMTAVYCRRFEWPASAWCKAVLVLVPVGTWPLNGWSGLVQCVGLMDIWLGRLTCGFWDWQSLCIWNIPGLIPSLALFPGSSPTSGWHWASNHSQCFWADANIYHRDRFVTKTMTLANKQSPNNHRCHPTDCPHRPQLLSLVL